MTGPDVVVGLLGVEHIEDVLPADVVALVADFDGDGVGTSDAAGSGDDSLDGIEFGEGGQVECLVAVVGVSIANGDVEGQASVAAGEGVDHLPRDVVGKDQGHQSRNDHCFHFIVIKSIAQNHRISK